MEAKYRVFNNSSKRKVIKEVCEVLPNISVSIFTKTFIIETIYLCDLSGFVVSSEESDSIFVSDLERDEERHTFYREVTSINVIPKEEVVRIRNFPSNTKQFHQIMKLSMNISTNRNRTAHCLHIRFMLKNFLCFFA